MWLRVFQKYVHIDPFQKMSNTQEPLLEYLKSQENIQDILKKILFIYFSCMHMYIYSYFFLGLNFLSGKVPTLLAALSLTYLTLRPGLIC